MTRARYLSDVTSLHEAYDSGMIDRISLDMRIEQLDTDLFYSLGMLQELDNDRHEMVDRILSYGVARF